MIDILIIYASIWGYPILSFFALAFTKEKPTYRWILVLSVLILAILVIVCLRLDIYFVFSFLNTFFFCFLYFGICLVLWLLFEIRVKITRILVLVLMILTFGGICILSIIGFFALLLVFNEKNNYTEQQITKDITYRETTQGYAFTDYYGVNVEIYKDCTYLPLLRKRLVYKKYTNNTMPYSEVPYSGKIKVECNSGEDTIYLSSTKERNGETTIWGDTISLR